MCCFQLWVVAATFDAIQPVLGSWFDRDWPCFSVCRKQIYKCYNLFGCFSSCGCSRLVLYIFYHVKVKLIAKRICWVDNFCCICSIRNGCRSSPCKKKKIWNWNSSCLGRCDARIFDHNNVRNEKRLHVLWHHSFVCSSSLRNRHLCGDDCDYNYDFIHWVIRLHQRNFHVRWKLPWWNLDQILVR